MRATRISFTYRRHAFTLLEAIIAIVIVGSLLGLLLPALQAVRAAARANACKSNLHQIGLAIANFENVKGAIPAWWVDDRFGTLRGSMIPLLPYLDQRPLWEEMALNGDSGDAVVEVLLCPDDGNAWVKSGQLSYAYNGGTKFLLQVPDGNGLVSRPRWTATGRGGITLSEIRDGLSHTAAMSERLQADPQADAPHEEVLRSETGRYLWYTRMRYSEAGEEELAAEECRTSTTTPIPYLWAPSSRELRFLPNGYTHLLPPNHRACYNAADRFDRRIDYELIPSSSQHAGGAHLLMADGQVRFVSESIGDSPWRAAGTRAGGEAEGLK